MLGGIFNACSQGDAYEHEGGADVREETLAISLNLHAHAAIYKILVVHSY